MAGLPVDIWLMILDDFDNDTLWSTIRNVSQYLRDCVDEFFRPILRETVINLTYSTIHSSPAPPYRYVFLPMRFSHLCEDGTHAVFQQAQYTNHNPNATYNVKGSVRGWVPFIERYCQDTSKPGPVVKNKSKSTPGPPQWEKTLPTSSSREPYAAMLRQQTSIGRGDRPPYCILIGKHVHDTELVDLAIDCAKRTIIFDWRRTFSAFFTEAHFVALAIQHPGRLAVRKYDPALSAFEGDEQATRRTRGGSRPPRTPYTGAWREARRKRLESWVKTNQKRMSLEQRYITECSVEFGKSITTRQLVISDLSDRSYFRFAELEERRRVSDLLVELHDDDIDAEEVVPERCAGDCRDLMMWPRTRSERKEAEYVPPPKIYKHPCVVL